MYMIKEVRIIDEGSWSDPWGSLMGLKWQISISIIKKSENGKGNDKAFGRVMKIYAEIYNKGSYQNDRDHGAIQGVHLWGSIWV